jgi:hypothetical protein
MPVAVTADAYNGFHLMNKSIRLTVGQALVRFLAVQHVERDGRQNRFIEGIWGIFGHGNVSGLGQGIVEEAGHNAFLDYSEFAAWQTLETSCGLGIRRAAL